MRRPFPNKESVSLESCNASFVYFRYGSAGGNPDTRADTHMWTFSFTLPEKRFLFVKKTKKNVVGLVSVSCRTDYDADKVYFEEHGKSLYSLRSLSELRKRVENQFQNYPQTFLVCDVDDTNQSFNWSDLNHLETRLAIDALVQLVFKSQSSHARNNENCDRNDLGMYKDRLETSFRSKRGRINYHFHAPATTNAAPNLDQFAEAKAKQLEEEVALHRQKTARHNTKSQ